MLKRFGPFSLSVILLSTALLSCGGQSNETATAAATTEAPAVTTEAPSNAEPQIYPLDGKTFVFLGSSVTYGSASNGWSMVDYIGENHDCTVIKWAVSGTTLVDNGSTSYVQRMLSGMRRQKACDHFICQLSTNDATQNQPLGKVSESMNKEDFDTSTVIGAMEYIIATAKEQWNCPVSFYTGTYYESAAYQKMVDALFELQKKWDIGIIDLWNDPEMRAIDTQTYNRYMSDSIHPTKEGYEKWWGPKFAEHLQKYE